ncbi:MAG TPA: endonuclease [Bacteroidales bacterium]|nr:endonuclease [Bacteroidales bacterium]HQG56215.1 endonuclease [Bacteroidales bacterium]
MLYRILLRILLLIICIVSNFKVVTSQENARRKYRFMFYNVENLFDTENDPATEDDEFLPGGERRWNANRYRQKLQSIYKVITAAGQWDPPEIIGICEVENKKVIDDLLTLTPLNVQSIYDIVHEDSDDPRGIDVCLIYRKDRIKLLYYKYIYPHSLYYQKIRTRKILYTKFLVEDDTLHLFLNHWPSRRGGVLAGEGSRIALANLLRQQSDSVRNSSGECSKIIFAGDFNSLPSSDEIKVLTASGEKGSFLNLGMSHFLRGTGTYKYEGIWEMPDQIIVSKTLLPDFQRCKGIYTSEDFFEIFSPDFLLLRDRKFSGQKPFSTYSGYSYQGGFSDHLPVILDLVVQPGR